MDDFLLQAVSGVYWFGREYDPNIYADYAVGRPYGNRQFPARSGMRMPLTLLSSLHPEGSLQQPCRYRWILADGYDRPRVS